MRNKLKSATSSIPIFLFGCLLAVSFGCGRAPEGEESPAKVSDHIGKAQAFYLQGNYVKAAQMYHKALEMEPQSSEACLKLGIIYDDNLKDKSLAASYYREFLRLEPDSDMADRVREWLEDTLTGAVRLKTSPAPAKRISPPPTRPAEVLPSPPPPGRPRPTPARAVRPSAVAGDDSYTVRGGDTLAGIARKLYGDPNAWSRIFEANREQLENPHALKVGQVLIIPR